MTREEIEKAIENGEDVWVATDSDIEQLSELKWHNNDIGSYNKNKYCFHTITEDYFNHLYKTKAEAEHYLHHANVTRTETLPFLTWEEFDKGNRLIRFIGKNGEKCKLEGYQKDDKQSGFIDVVVNGTGSNIDFDYTEANFYKAYDECVRLFMGMK